MKKNSFWVRLIVNALAFLIVSKIYGGMEVESFWGAVIAALIWGIINALLRPLLMLLTLPLNILTLGLFTFVINGVILLLTAELYSGLVISSFFAGIFAAFLLSVVNVILTSLLVKEEEK
jgi:putative membrane protein